MSFKNLYVNNLPDGLTNPDLVALFKPFNASTATVMLDAKTGQSKGYGFVGFQSEEEGRAALQALHGKDCTFNGETFMLHATPSKHRGREAPKSIPAIFVRNVPLVVPTEAILLHFKKFGSVVNLTSRQDPKIEGMAQLYVEYDHVDQAQNAIDNVHGITLFPDVSPTPSMAKFASATVARQYGHAPPPGSKNKNRKRRSPTEEPPVATSARSGGGTPPVGLSPDEASTSLLSWESDSGASVGACSQPTLAPASKSSNHGSRPAAEDKRKVVKPIPASADNKAPSHQGSSYSSRTGRSSSASSHGSGSTRSDEWDNSEPTPSQSPLAIPKIPSVYRHEPYRNPNGYVLVCEEATNSSPTTPTPGRVARKPSPKSPQAV